MRNNIAKNKDMDEKRNMIYLAALLHDIGKFYQRAMDNKPDFDIDEFGYQHADWTYDFFQLKDIKQTLEKVPGLTQNLYVDTEKNQFNVANLATNHHKPQNLYEAMVTLGDWWSAGMDRTNFKDIQVQPYGGKNVDWGKDRYKTIPLFSIFNIINDGNGIHAFPLKGLDTEKDIFPKPVNSKDDGTNQEQYQELWREFVKEFKELPTDSLGGFTDSLLFLLKKYTWAIPSNTMDMANVSLYEHLKTTSAFADSIYAYYESNSEDFRWNNSDKRLILKEGKHPVMLLGVNISGIQKFIYNIASSKAAKSLKGRSFYLELLIDAMIQQIINHKEIKATFGHVIYSSGGKFYMILPNTENVKDALADITKEFEQQLWEEHKGKISVNFGYSAFVYRNKKENNEWENWIEIEGQKGRKQLNDLWKSVADKINVEKNKQFKSLLIDHWDEFFDETNDKLKAKEDAEICAVTGEQLYESNKKVLDKDADNNKIYVSNAVYNQTDLGTVLKDADYLIVFKGNDDDDKYLSTRSKTKISVLGINYYLFDQTELTYNDADFRGITSADTSRVFRINNTKFLDAKLKGNGISYGYLFYGGNEQAYLRDDDGNTIYTKDKESRLGKKAKNFEELTQVEPGKKGKETYLGVLRMDIDNLGNIFIKGFDENQRSFSAFATLSFLLDWFFSGYLNTIRYNEKYRDWVNILYSGGDDVFAIGRWDKLIEFAREVQQDFTAFTGRGDITLSAGMVAVRNKFPISKAADLAGEAEEKSKKYNDEKKNAFTFFGETVSWKEEFDFVKNYKDDFYNKIEKDEHLKMSKAILHRLMQFAEMKKENERKQKEDDSFKLDLSYKWNTAYYLKRFSQRHKINGEEVHKEFIMNKLITDLFVDNKTNRHYEKIALACRWAELLLKVNTMEIKE